MTSRTLVSRGAPPISHRSLHRHPGALQRGLAVLALAGAPSALGAQALDRTRPPELAPPPPLRVPAAQTARLANGLELVVVEMHEVPVVDVTLTLRAGAVRDPDDLPGLATFTANMLDEGAGGRGALEIAEEAGYLGASLATRAGLEQAIVSLHVPKRQLGPALDLMADVTLRPTFPDSEVARQRDLRRTAIIQLRDEPVQIAPIAFNAIVFGAAHPYGRPSGGTEASTAALNRDRVVQFYRTYYRPNNARLLIVGDVTLGEARELAAQRFGAWERGEVPPLPAPSPVEDRRRTFYLVDKPGAAQSVIRIGHVGIPRSSPDYYTVQVLNTILGGAFTSRLNQNLRETKGYTYGAFSSFDALRLPGPFRANASVVTAKTDSSIIEFLGELRRIRDEEVGEAELAKAKAYLTLGLPREFETTSGTAELFLDLLANDLPLDTYASAVRRINSVTAADVRRVARRYIDPERFIVVVVGDRSQIESGLRALNEGPVELRDMWGQPLR
jgi:predicted Zn-dependent peptidase